nr:hypothetical protein Iba_chr02aCG13590 [Ipomoea batatas]
MAYLGWSCGLIIRMMIWSSSQMVKMHSDAKAAPDFSHMSSVEKSLKERGAEGHLNINFIQ